MTGILPDNSRESQADSCKYLDNFQICSIIRKE